MQTFLLSFVLINLSSTTFAHEGHHHGSHTQANKLEELPPNMNSVFKGINESYDFQVKPIFDSKCAACHSATSQAPSYASIPIIHWIVESDMSEAMEHLEISKGFPFAGHGTPEEDLTAIKEVTNKNSMPTRLYSFMHPSSRVTDEEKQKILMWVDESEKSIEKLKTSEKKP
jgi:hypothetical protein